MGHHQHLHEGSLLTLPSASSPPSPSLESAASGSGFSGDILDVVVSKLPGLKNTHGSVSEDIIDFSGGGLVNTSLIVGGLKSLLKTPDNFSTLLHVVRSEFRNQSGTGFIFLRQILPGALLGFGKSLLGERVLTNILETISTGFDGVLSLSTPVTLSHAAYDGAMVLLISSPFARHHDSQNQQCRHKDLHGVVPSRVRGAQ